jgi:gliding motility-associated-like protein
MNAEEEKSPKSWDSFVEITGRNVFCIGEDSVTTLTVNILADDFPEHRIRWIPGDSTTSSITVTVPSWGATYLVEVIGKAADGMTDTTLFEGSREVFMTERPTKPTRLNDTLCREENREAVIGMTNTTANSFLWYPDFYNESYVGLCVRPPHNNLEPCNPWANDFPPEFSGYPPAPKLRGNPPEFPAAPPQGPTRNIFTPVDPPHEVTRSIFHVKMSNHPLTGSFENYCYSWDSVFIEIIDTRFHIDVASDTVCEGTSVTLSLSTNQLIGERIWYSEDTIFRRGTNVNSITVEIPEAGEHVFSVELPDENGCTRSPLLTITALPIPKDVFIVTDFDTVCRGDSAILTVVGDFGSVLWTNSRETSESTTIWPRGQFTYTVRVYGDANQGGCFTILDTVIHAKNCDVVYFPNAIKLSSTNEKNRIWRPIVDPELAPAISQYYFAIFDRWGQLIFESRNLDHGWNGTHQNQTVRPGVYVYLFRLTNKQDVWERTGTITVVD